MATQGEIIRAVLSYSHPAGSVCQNVFTFELQDEDSSDAEVVADLDDWFETFFVPLWEDMADSNVVLFLAEYDVINVDGTVARNLGEELHADPGTAVGDVMPAAVSGFIQADTERSKSYGRKYMPGLSEDSAVEGILTAARLAELILILGWLVQDAPVGIAGLLVPGVLSRVTETFLEFTGSGYATDVPAYQRRRKPGVGS